MSSFVNIDGLVFYGDGTDDNWIYQAMPAWYSSAPMKGQSVDYPMSDGQSPIAKAYRSAKAFTFEGTLAARTPAEAIGRWMQFAAIQSDGRPFPITVGDPFGELTCIVTLDGSAEVIEINNLGAEVGATFIAHDPIKYGPSRSVVTGLPTAGGGLEYPLHSPSGALYYGSLGNLGRVTLTNAGTAAVWPSVVVSGGLSAGFFIQRLDTGQVVRYDRVVPDGSTVSIDFRTGEVLVDGISDGSTYLTRSEFFSIGPGVSADVQFNAIGGSSGTPAATFTISDGYW